MMNTVKTQKQSIASEAWSHLQTMVALSLVFGLLCFFGTLAFFASIESLTPIQITVNFWIAIAIFSAALIPAFFIKSDTYRASYVLLFLSALGFVFGSWLHVCGYNVKFSIVLDLAWAMAYMMLYKLGAGYVRKTAQYIVSVFGFACVTLTSHAIFHDATVLGVLFWFIVLFLFVLAKGNCRLEKTESGPLSYTWQLDFSVENGKAFIKSATDLMLCKSSVREHMEKVGGILTGMKI